jgi:hypothetical protein
LAFHPRPIGPSQIEEGVGLLPAFSRKLSYFPGGSHRRLYSSPRDTDAPGSLISQTVNLAFCEAGKIVVQGIRPSGFHFSLPQKRQVCGLSNILSD